MCCWFMLYLYTCMNFDANSSFSSFIRKLWAIQLLVAIFISFFIHGLLQIVIGNQEPNFLDIIEALSLSFWNDNDRASIMSRNSDFRLYKLVFKADINAYNPCTKWKITNEASLNCYVLWNYPEQLSRHGAYCQLLAS